ncbi:MAG: adenylate/guanylate cyclase domain-containing protein [Burkholderiales bacterium]
MMAERANRTFICSVLFLDIVEYSRKPVAEQIRLKDRFNALIAEAIRDVPASDRIILDTGDGVAVNFLGDPEDALFVAMSLRDSFAPEPDAPPTLPARIGINLGPVRLVRDLNGQPNIIGDGINVAQRVMGFARPGQIVVSRSYYEVVSHISEGYGQLFQYEGSRTDKHVREHEIYSVGYSQARASLIRSPAERAQASTREGAQQAATANIAAGNLWKKIEPWLNNRSIAYGTATLSVGAFALALLLNFLGPEQPVEERQPLSDTQQSAEQKPEVREVPGEETGIFGFPRRDPEKRSGETAAVAERESESGPQSPSTTSRENQTAPTAQRSANNAVIALAITPWGEVYVDGQRVGVSPPVKEVRVAPGRRSIEIRNGEFPVYTQTIDLQAEDRIRIRHKFN